MHTELFCVRFCGSSSRLNLHPAPSWVPSPSPPVWSASPQPSAPLPVIQAGRRPGRSTAVIEIGSIFLILRSEQYITLQQRMTCSYVKPQRSSVPQWPVVHLAASPDLCLNPEFGSTLVWKGVQNPFCCLLVLALPALSTRVPTNGRRCARGERSQQENEDTSATLQQSGEGRQRGERQG